MWKKNQGQKDGASSSYMDFKSQKMEIQSIMKDIEYIGSKHMTWKQRKELENRKIVSLGGKPVKKQRLPLSVARVMMKKQKERDEKMLQESSILRSVGGNSGTSKKSVEKRNQEGRLLKSTAGTFRNGVLDVKNLLKTSTASRDDDGGHHGGSKGKKRKGGKKNQGKKKGGGRKRH